MKFAIFITTASRNKQDDKYATLDRLFAQKLQDGLQNAQFLDGIYTQEEIFTHIEQNAANTHPILHIILNCERRNNLFSIQALQAFKSRGGKIVITFAKFDDFRYATQKNVALNYLYCADHVFFLDEADKKSALESVKHYFPSEKGFKARLEKSTVTSTFPANTYLAGKKPNEREGNIIFLGTVRPGLGFAHIRKLATLLAKSEDPKLRNKKIIIIAQAANEIRQNRVLMELIETLYPSKKEELQNKTTEQLKELLKTYQADGRLKPEVAMELHLESHLNVSKQELSKLYDQCTYCFFPTAGGPSLQDHALKEALSQKFIIISHSVPSTAATLKEAGLEKAFCLLENDDFKTYAEAVMAKILERENNPVLNRETFELLGKIEAEHLNSDKIIIQHREVYRGLTAEAAHGATKEEPKLSQEKLKTLTHAFRGWRNIPLTLKHACIQEARSFSTMRKIQGIDTIARAHKNYNALVLRLKNLEGPYSDAMKQHLLAQNIRGSSYLTKEERVLLKKLLASNWTLKHVTEHIEVINENGEQLLSVEERKRRADQNNFSHTPAMEGNADNVFFSFGPGDIPTVRFLDLTETYIEVDYKQLIQDNPNPDVEDNALHGFWSSDHFYAYGAEQDGEPINIYGARYFVNYRKVVDDQSGQVRWVKNCHFIHPDGKAYIQTIEKGDEIFIHPRVDIALVLLTIEKIRFLGLEAWKKIMQETDLKALQCLVYTIYHTGVFEVHKPEQFLLDQPGVQVKTRRTRKTEEAAASNQSVNQGKEILKAAVTGNIELVLKELASGTNINKSYQIHISDAPFNDKLRFSTITLLTAAILGGQPELVKKMLEMGVDLYTYAGGTHLTIPTGPTSSHSVGISALTTACFTTTVHRLEQTGSIYPALKKSLFGEEAHEWDFKKIAESSQIIFKMLLEQGSSAKDNKNIQFLEYPDSERELAQVYKLVQPEQDIMLYIIQHLPDKPPENALIYAALFQHLEVAKKLLTLGCDPNKELHNFYHEFTNGLNTSLTPLLVAIQKNDLAMIQLLVQHKVDVNKAYYETGGERVECPAKVTEKTGQTPLMFAIEMGNMNVIQCLLDNKADILKQNLSGLNALDFARKLGKHEIEKILSEKLLAIRKTEQTTSNGVDLVRKTNNSSPDLKSDKEGAQLALYDHRVFIIAKAFDHNNETFILLNKENYECRNFGNLHTGFLHTFNAKKWIIDLKQHASAAFNFNELQFTEYAEIQMGIKETGTHYMAKFIICDFGLQNEAFFFAMKGSEAIALLSVKELLQKSNEARTTMGSLGFKHEDQFISDFEVDLFLQLKDGIKTVTPEMQERIHRKFHKNIQDQRQVIEYAKAGNVHGIEEAMRHGISFDLRLPTIEAEKFNQPEHHFHFSNKYEMITLSPIIAAISHKQFDFVLYLLGQGIDPNKGNNFTFERVNEIVASGNIKLFKELHRQKHWAATSNHFMHLQTCTKHGNFEFMKFLFSIFTYKPEECNNLLAFTDTIKNINFEIIALLTEKAQESAIENYLSSLMSCYQSPEGYFTAEELKKFKENAEAGKIFDKKTENEMLKILQHLLPRVRTNQTSRFSNWFENAVYTQNMDLCQLFVRWYLKDVLLKDGMSMKSCGTDLVLCYKLRNYSYMKYLDFIKNLLGFIAESGLDPRGYFRTAFLQMIDSGKAPCNEVELKGYVGAIEKLYPEILPEAVKMREAIIKGESDKVIAHLKQGFAPDLLLLAENPWPTGFNMSYNYLGFSYQSLMEFSIIHRRYDVAQYLMASNVKLTTLNPRIIIENLIREKQIGLLKYIARTSDENTLVSINMNISYYWQYNNWGIKLDGVDQKNGLDLVIRALELAVEVEAQSKVLDQFTRAEELDLSTSDRASKLRI